MQRGVAEVGGQSIGGIDLHFQYAHVVTFVISDNLLFGTLAMMRCFIGLQGGQDLHRKDFRRRHFRNDADRGSG